LLKLSSLLLLAATAERIPTSHMALVEHEVTTIVSEIADYSRKQHEVRPSRGVVGKPGYTARQTVSPAVNEYQNAIGDGQARPAPAHIPSERKDRIRAIVREKGQVGIKDISDIITGVSEKSIQRDLNDMIEKGEIVRIGERRWSTYRMS
jgi:predicted HTH transcriptional regulator